MDYEGCLNPPNTNMLIMLVSVITVVVVVVLVTVIILCSVSMKNKTPKEESLIQSCLCTKQSHYKSYN